MIRVSNPLFSAAEAENLQACIQTGWVSSAGGFVKQFEKQMTEYHQLSHGIAVSSGTAALETALYAAGLSEGDEVLLPNLTMIACASSLVRLGLVPVPVEVNAETWNIDLRDMQRKVTPKTKGLMLVHLFGLPCDMSAIMDFARHLNLKVIEDCAQALGSQYDEQKLGSFGHVAAFSFFANKIITTGEGGMVLTDSDEAAERARNYRNLFLGVGSDRFEHSELGMNYRMSNLQAAVGVGQFSQLEHILELKQSIARRYDEALEGYGLQLPFVHPKYHGNSWMYAFVLPPKGKLNAAELAARLKNRGVESRRFFVGLHRQPALERFKFEPEFKVSDELYDYGLYIPSGPNLSESDQTYVIQTIQAELKHAD